MKRDPKGRFLTGCPYSSGLAAVLSGRGREEFFRAHFQVQGLACLSTARDEPPFCRALNRGLE
jgi:hypothetical protein